MNFNIFPNGYLPNNLYTKLHTLIHKLMSIDYHRFDSTLNQVQISPKKFSDWDYYTTRRFISNFWVIQPLTFLCDNKMLIFRFKWYEKAWFLMYSFTKILLHSFIQSHPCFLFHPFYRKANFTFIYSPVISEYWVD